MLRCDWRASYYVGSGSWLCENAGALQRSRMAF